MITQSKITQFYSWQNYRCAYELHNPSNLTTNETPLLLIHPIGVGLSGKFWQRFYQEWDKIGRQNPIYNPDLLGCPQSDMPHVAYTPSDWAGQLQYFIQTVIQKSVIVVVQGALLPVAIELAQKQADLIHAFAFSGPPAWTLISKESPSWRQKLIWNVLDSPLGNAFYRYARSEKFLRSFSTRQLFDSEDAVDTEWLNMLHIGAENVESRYAVFSFLSGFWRHDYSRAIASIIQPTLVVMGEKATSISSKDKQETADERLANYLTHLPQGSGVKILGRNVLPYESAPEFVRVLARFVDENT